MKRWVGCFLIIGLLVGMTPVASAVPVPACSLCILEVGAIGLNGQEDQDFVIIANVTGSSITSSSIQLRYYNSVGILDSTLGIGTFTPGQVKIYASDSLRNINTSATTLPLALYSGGGRLQIARSTSTTTTTYDQVAWGTAIGGEGLPAPSLAPGVTLARNESAGIVADTNQNNADFQLHDIGCNGIEFSEVQPFVTDSEGRATAAWLELLGHSNELGDCQLITAAGDNYLIPSDMLPNNGQFAVIEQGIIGGNAVPLHIGEATRHIWLTGVSAFGPFYIPLTDQTFSSLDKGQSWAQVDGVWRGTYALTPGEANVYQAHPARVGDDADVCSSVRITELLPNPSGTDTGHEWMELHNVSNEPAPLTQCMITVADDQYYFLPEDSLAGSEWRTFYTLRDASGNEKQVSLRNSDDTFVSLFGLHTDGTQQLIQSFVYSNAPEGQAWARLDDGWQWQNPTPDLDNAVDVSTDTQGPTEHPAVPTSSGTFVYTAPAQPLQITELLPNPASPETDENDEFVELFNPNNEPVMLANYKLQTGNSYSYSYALTDQIIQAHSYMVLKSSQTHLPLSNSSGRARLLDPTGSVMAETDPYTDAPEGQSWVLSTNGWQWSGTPTAGEVNKVTLPILASAIKAVKKTATTPKSTKSSAPKTSAVKAAKTGTKSKNEASKPASRQAAKTAAAPPIHPLVLAGVGGIALAYAGYEYRQDVRNKFIQLRANRAARKALRK